ncbi:MAG: UDP-3-O-acyl-N-acetylglucosamine deacetylase [Proteobacteria bacterium]|nr:UDP-3-O-acyl-N-acetylglucosamine deacetylase [Pseudomonadota bacterium]
MNQTTIKNSFIIKDGHGLHSGEKTDLYFFPAPENHGIVFYRGDKKVRIPASYQYAKSSALCTTIESEGVEVTTIEHLLSVCNGLGIDNLLIELHSLEVPIMDGSGYDFYTALQDIGLKQLDTPKKVVKVLEPVTYEYNDITIFILPSDKSNFTFSIDYNHRQIGQQEMTFQLTEKNYIENIAKAKTFGFRRDYQELLNQGLVKGGNNKNAIILDEEGNIENLEEMTWLNEPNLHKILDQVGDFYLANNHRIIGDVFCHKSGHSTHLAFIRYMMDECPNSFTVIDYD